MSLLEGDGNFKWGKVDKTVNGFQGYESLIYKGVEYSLYDCIYVIHVHSMETSIGKIVKMWENPKRDKKLKVIYFFRPKDIINFLNFEPRWNELFLACGEGEGVSDTFEVGKILGKCNVFYISDDKRNPPAANLAVKEGDYYFSSTFNVGTKKVSKSLPEAIEDVAMEKLLSRRKKVRFEESSFPERINEKRTGIADSGSGTLMEVYQKPKDDWYKQVNARTITEMGGPPRTLRHPGDDRPPNTSMDDTTLKRKRDLNIENEEDMAMPGRRRIKEGGANMFVKEYKRDARNDSGASICNRELSRGNKSLQSGDAAFGVSQSARGCVKDVNKVIEVTEKVTPGGANVSAPDSVQKEYKRNAPGGSGTSITNRERSCGTKSLLRVGEKAGDKVIQVTKKPASDVSKWFNEELQPWEDRLQSAHQEGKLVFLTNLNPSYTSSEVEDIIYAAFQARVDAKIIPRVAHSSPHYGQAFAIFRHKDTAEKVITTLSRRNLIQVEGRPVVASRKHPAKPSYTCGFPGHLVIGDPKLKRSEAQRNAVSTSHSAQDNTIEYEFALEWRVLQARSDLRRKQLHQIQEEERQVLHKGLKEVQHMT